MKKRHHIIPEVYLKQWKDPEQSKRPIVFCLDKRTLQGRGDSPNSIFVETHYFTERDLDGTRSHPVEDYLDKQVETSLNQLISTLESAEPLTEDTRRDLWYFVMSMFTRVSWWRELLDNLINSALEKSKYQAVSQVVQKSTEGKNRSARRKAKSNAHRRKIASDVENKAPLILEPFAASITTKLHPSLVMASLTLEKVQVYPFKILRTGGIPLLSSDTPCFVEEDPSILNFNKEEVVTQAFVCPLTPNLAFVGGLGLSTGYSDVNSEWVRRFNARVRANAKEKLIANTSLVDESWFLEDPSSPLTMQEIVHNLGLSAFGAERKGFG